MPQILWDGEIKRANYIIICIFGAESRRIYMCICIMHGAKGIIISTTITIIMVAGVIFTGDE